MTNQMLVFLCQLRITEARGEKLLKSIKLHSTQSHKTKTKRLCSVQPSIVFLLPFFGCLFFRAFLFFRSKYCTESEREHFISFYLDVALLFLWHCAFLFNSLCIGVYHTIAATNERNSSPVILRTELAH